MQTFITLKGHSSPPTVLCKVYKLASNFVNNRMPFYLLASDGSHIKVWDLTIDPPKAVMNLTGHSERVTDIKPLTTNLVISSSTDPKLIIWDLRNPNSGKMIPIAETVTCIATFTSQTQVAVACNKTIKIIDIIYDTFDMSEAILESVWTKCELKDHYNITQLLTFRKNENLVVAGLSNGNINIWNINEKCILNSIEAFDKSPVTGMLLITCQTSSPEIYIMAYSDKENKIKFGNVDANVLKDLPISHAPNFTKCGYPGWQILDSNSDNGFSFMTIANHTDRNPAITLWNMTGR